MKSSSHLITGGVTVASLLALTSLETGIAPVGFGTISAFLKLDILGMTLLGSLLPDIDSNESIISRFIKNTDKSVSTHTRRIWTFFLVAFTFSSILYPAILFLVLYGVRQYYSLRNTFKADKDHRALPHSIFGLIGFSVAIYFLQSVTGLTLLIPFSLTYALHLVFDCFTMQGIPLFGIGLRSMHVRMPRILCYSNNSSNDLFATPIQEAIIAYGYTLIVGFPFIQRAMLVLK